MRVDAADDPPGTIKLLSQSSFLIDQANGDAYIMSTSDNPAWFMFVGPMKVQVDFRVNIPKKGKGGPKSVILDIVANGKSVNKVRITANAGKAQWKKSGAPFKPSQPAEFMLDLGEGMSEIEFRVDGAGKFGAAMFVVNSAEATRPIGSDAPTIKIAAPAQAQQASQPETTAETTKTSLPSLAPPLPETEQIGTVRKEKQIKGTDDSDRPALHTEEEEKPATRIREAGKRNVLGLYAAGGAAMQEEPGAFGPAGAADVLVGVNVHLPVQLLAQLQYDGRFAAIAVPLTTETAPISTAEIRHAGQVGFGYNPVVWARGLWRLDVHALAQYRLAVHSNQLASAIWGAVGGQAGLTIARGNVALNAHGGYAQAIHDTTPDTVSTGRIFGRAFWQLGLSAEILPPLSFFAAYRGEVMFRTESWRQSHGIVMGLAVSVL